MTGDEDRAGAEYDQPRVPRPLREQVDELFLAARGYEPASFQEALSLVVDLAAESVDSDGDAGDATAEPRDDPTSSGPESPSQSGTGAASGAASAVSAGPDVAGDSGTEQEATTGDPADADDASEMTLANGSLDPDGSGSVSFDEYVEGLEKSNQGPSPGVESMLDTSHADGVVRELAAEVLDEMTQDAFQELEHGVDQGVGAGVTDGMGATQTADGAGTAPSGSTGDGVPDSLTADPESDCAVCGREHPVSVLQTTILEEDGSVALVCPSCAE